MGDDLSTASLVSILLLLLFLSAFFSGTETALMRLNRYKLKNQVRKGNKSAKILEKLLKEPEKLIGLICLGVNLVNFTAAALVTIIALKIGGEPFVAVATLFLTITVLIFCEAAPKTLAAIYPEKLAFPSALIYYPLMLVSYPMVWLISETSNAILWVLGFRQTKDRESSLSNEELRTVVREAGTLISRKYRSMLLNILDLEKVTVDDVMVPHTEISGINMEEDIEEIRETILRSEHTLLPVFSENINNIFGVLHLRKLANLSRKNLIKKQDIERLSNEPYFIQEGTLLNIQLVEFQRRKQRIAIVVDEYGDIQGIVTLSDILEEIVGEFTTVPEAEEEYTKENDNSYIVSGNANIRDLNKSIKWEIPSNGAKTVNGLIVEHLGDIPKAETDVNISNYSFKVIESDSNHILSVKINKIQKNKKE